MSLSKNKSTTKWYCMRCPETYEKVVTPGKTYDFHQTAARSNTIITFGYTYFTGDDGKEYDVNLIKDLNKYFMTLEEWRNNQLKKLEI
jgi:hypothetical protein